MAALYVVATPIGNLEDISRRALTVLQEVDLIAAEDTRVTRRLLSRYDISAKLVAYTDAYERSKAGRRQLILDALAAGQDVALVSDAGMPGLSDPGYELIRAVLESGHQLQVIPGPSAVTTALVASGLPADRFTFVGFLPRKRSARRSLLTSLVDDPGTLVAFETPHRLKDALVDLLDVLGNRQIAVARELSKRFEQVWRGELTGACDYFVQNPAKGEITLVVAGAGATPRAGTWPTSEVNQAVALLRDAGLSPATVTRIVVRLSGWRREEIYQLVTKVKGTPSKDGESDN